MAKRKSTPLTSGTLDLADDPVVEIGARQLRLGEPGAYILVKISRDHGLDEAEVEAVIEAAVEYRGALEGRP